MASRESSKKGPKRTDSHRGETESRNYTLRYFTDPFFLVRWPESDYGVDVEFEVLDKDGDPTNIKFGGQLKASNNKPKDKIFKYQIDVSNLLHLMKDPCSIYLFYSRQKKKLYFRWAIDIVREVENKNKDWKTQHKVTVTFRKIVTKKEVKEIRNKVLIDKGQLSEIHNSMEMKGIVSGVPIFYDPATKSVSSTDRFDELTNDTVLQHLAEWRELWRQGDKPSTYENVKAFTSSNQWDLIPDKAKAKILRFRASLELNYKDDVDTANRIADDAAKLSDEDDSLLRALIAHRKSGARDALIMLQNNTSMDCLHLQLGLHLELGNRNEAYDIVRDKIGTDKLEAEGNRLYSLLLIIDGDVDAALVHSKQALQQKPAWQAVRLTRAQVLYLSAFSSAAVKAVTEYPPPVEAIYVKSDLASEKRLNEAFQLFTEILDQVNDDVFLRSSIRGWRLACLMNLSEQREEAESACSEWLQEDPEHPYPLLWALLRGVPFDKKRHLKHLREVIDQDKAEIQQLSVFFSLAISSIEFMEHAKNVLEKSETAYSSAGQLGLWEYWRARFKEPSSTKVESESDVHASDILLIQARLERLEAGATSIDDWTEVIREYKAAYQKTEDTQFLLNQLVLLSRHGIIDGIIDTARLVLAKLFTTESLLMVLNLLLQTKQLHAALELMEEFAALIPEPEPLDFVRIRAFCLTNTGRSLEAIKAVEHIPKSKLDLRDQHQHYHNLMITGDIHGGLSTARGLLHHPNISPDIALNMAHSLLPTDQQLAKKFLTKIDLKSVDDELVPQLVFLSLQLDERTTLSMLHPRFQEMGEKELHGIKLASLDELLKWHDERLHQFQQANDFYRKSMLPIHLLSEQLGRPLSSIYFSFLQENSNRKAFAEKVPVYIRHGGLDVEASRDSLASIKRLNVDLSSLMLAQASGILDLVENQFKPIRISSFAIPALQKELNSLHQHQPDRIEAAQNIRRLISEHRIERVELEAVDEEDITANLNHADAQSLVHAKRNDGYYVTFVPLHHVNTFGEPVEVPSESANHLLSLFDLLASMSSNALITEDRRGEVQTSLGESGAIPFNSKMAEPGVSLVVNLGCLILLDREGLLEQLVQAYRLVVTESDARRIFDELKAYEDKESVASSVNMLIDRLGEGIRSGTYELLPVAGHGKDQGQDSITNDTTIHALFDLLGDSSRFGDGDVLWIDDRTALGMGIKQYGQNTWYHHVSIVEVLKAIAIQEEVLKEAKHFSVLQQLRRANARWIPISSGELVYHLLNAPLSDEGDIVETSELFLVRQYYSYVLGNVDDMITTPEDSDVSDKSLSPQPEVHFLTRLVSAAMGAFIDLWDQTNGRLSEFKPRAEWLLSSFYFSYNDLVAVIPFPKAMHLYHDLGAQHLILFVARGHGLFEMDRFDLRQEFYNWLDETLFVPLLRTNSRIKQKIVNGVITFFTDLYSQLENSDGGSPDTLLSKTIVDLPQSIRDDVLSRPQFEERTKSLRQVVTSSFSFLTHDLYEALSAVVNAGTATIKTLNGEGVTLTKSVDDKDRPEITALSTTGVSEVFDWSFHQILSNQPDVRSSVLESMRHDLDVSDPMFVNLAEQLDAAASPDKAVDIILSKFTTSAVMFYREFEKDLQSGRLKSFGSDAMLPAGVVGLLRHLRLEKTAIHFPETWYRATIQLLDELDLPDALQRMIAAPIELAPEVYEALVALDVDEFTETMRWQLDRTSSPVGLFHLLRLIALRHKESEKLQELQNELVEHLSSPNYRIVMKAFNAALGWSYDQFNKIPGSSDISLQNRLLLAWSHSSRIFNIMHGVGIQPSNMLEGFENLSTHSQSSSVSPLFFSLKSQGWDDVNHPRFANPLCMMLDGLGFALCSGGESTDLSEKTLSQISAVLNYDNSEGDLKRVRDIFFALSNTSNCISSMFGQRRWDLLHDYEITDLRPSLFDSSVEEALQELSEDNSDLNAWGKLVMHTVDIPVNHEHWKKLETIWNSSAVAEGVKDIEPLVLRYYTMQAWRYGSIEIANELVDIAETWAEEIVTGDIEPEQDPRWILINEVLFFASLARDSQEERVKQHSKFLQRFASIDPHFAEQYRNYVFRLWRELPIELSRHFFRLVLWYRER